MLENVPENTKRFVPPPPPRNRSIGRRKSGDRFDKANYLHGTDGERNQASSYPRNFPGVERGELAGSNYENTHPKLIHLEGCSSSETVQFLAERWTATVRFLDDPSADISGKPIVYSGASGSSWVHFKVPHQMDFLGELQRKIQIVNSKSDSTSDDG